MGNLSFGTRLRVSFFNYKSQIANYKTVSSFLAIIDHGSDFGSELLFHALHDRVLFGSTAGASVGWTARRGHGLGRSTRLYLHLYRPSPPTAGWGAGDATRFGIERHFDHGGGCRYLCGQRVSAQGPLCGFQDG